MSIEYELIPYGLGGWQNQCQRVTTDELSAMNKLNEDGMPVMVRFTVMKDREIRK